MKMKLTRRLLGAWALSLLGLTCAQAQTPAFPSQQIKLIVPYPAGGATDILARMMGQKFSEAWNVPVVVENKPGAGGTIGNNLVARANPDGYTLLSVSSAHTVAPAIYAKLPYDTRKDLAGITGTATSKYVLVVAPTQPYRNVKDLVAAAKAKPGALNFSSAGVGSGTHFAGELFKSLAKVDVVHVPFKGIPEALTETMSGRVQFFMSPIANAVNLVKDGKVTALGVSSPRRDPLLPDVPTVIEGGVPGFEAELWFGLLTSTRVPKPLLARLNQEIVAILREPEVKQRWAPLGLEPIPSTPERFDQRIAEDMKLYAELAKAGNIKAE